ncbi:MAG: hypothetical protein IK116_03605 [Firmicutes bacterium]|nr:hypothetical protein [Bacillota bacterium]
MDYAVQITPLPDGSFRAHNPLGVADFDELEEAVKATEAQLLPWMTERARKAGAADPQVTCDRYDDIVWFAGHKRSMYFGTQLLFSVRGLGGDGDEAS